MAVDMTDLTTAQYRQHIEEMGIEDIQKSIEYYEQPGYNCSGLVTADGVISPRTRILHEVLNDKVKRKEKGYTKIKRELTALQWAKEGFVLNPDAVGEERYTNSRYLMKAVYYREYEVYEDKEAAKKILKSRRKDNEAAKNK